MTRKPLVLRALADRDIEDALDHYFSNSPAAASGFVDRLEQAFNHLRRAPATGSPRYAYALGLQGLRSWPLSRYLYLVFYVEHADRIDVWRVLHTNRDIPEHLRDADGKP